MRPALATCLAFGLLAASCANPKIDVFAPPPPPKRITTNQPVPLPIRISSTQGVVTNSPGQASDGCPPQASCQHTAKYWTGGEANAFDLVQSGPQTEVSQCSLAGVTSMTFRDRDQQTLLIAKAGPSGWNTVIVESPTGFRDAVPNEDWGEGWPIGERVQTARSIEFSAPPSCQPAVASTVFQCDATKGCFFLRVDLLRGELR